ncbi:hypothetical protein TthAA220_21840 (plasmid) [Thermus thermophilus]|nr:hypothetical protein TthAA220_21840 [Thermus thermophilus]
MGMRLLSVGLTTFALGWVVGAQAQEVVRIATVGVVSDVAIYIAIEKGFFTQQGIAIQLTQNLHLCTLGIVMLGGPLERGRRFPV